MKLLTSTALVIGLAATGAMAEQHTMNTDDLIRTRDITGGAIYSTGTEMDDDSWGSYEAMGLDDTWTDIGEIEDIVLDQQGQMVGVVAEVGGFLDIADKHVLISMDDVKLSAQEDGSYVVVTRQTEEQLESMEGIDESFME